MEHHPAGRRPTTTCAESGAERRQASAPDWGVVDLCCGVGGLSLAAVQVGCRPIIGVDLSKSALETFAANFPTAHVANASVTRGSALRSCREAIAQSKPKRLLVVSGPPCQGFSVAGPRQKRDPRNRVLLAVAARVVDLAPDAALIENVSALMKPRHARTVRRFRRRLERAGYTVLAFELDAADYGVPQTRKRVLFVAAKTRLDHAALADRLEGARKAQSSAGSALAGLESPVVYDGKSAPGSAPVPNHVAMRHSDRVRKKIAALRPGQGPMSYRRLDPTKPARTLISGHRAPPAHPSEARSITPREAARLQGFPDSFVFRGAFANQLLHVTNAVPPPLASTVLHILITAVEEEAA